MRSMLYFKNSLSSYRGIIYESVLNIFCIYSYGDAGYAGQCKELSLF